MSLELRNRVHNCTNPHQGEYKRVLCVCSAGLLRSPTAAEVLSREPFNFNTRAVGIVPQFALIPIDEVLLRWSDEIVCMTPDHAEMLKQRIEEWDTKSKIVCLDIPDRFGFRDPQLQELIAAKYVEVSADNYER